MSRTRFYLPAFGLLLLSFWLLFRNIQTEPAHANTAHVFMLTTLKIWEEKGSSEYHYAPVQTWPDATRFNQYYKRLEDKQGNNYYISHPPLAFLANFYILKVFGLPLDQRSLQSILIFLFLSGAVLLAWIIRQSEKQADKRQVYLAMLSAMAFYLLNPVNLYAHSQHNFSEIWGQFFLITTLSAWVFYLQSDRIVISRILLFISVALLAATDWMGLTLIVALVAVYFRQLKKPHIRHGIFLVSASVVVTMSVVCFQYISIAGSDAFLHSLGIRYLERSGFFGGHYTDMGYDVFNPETWLMLLMQIQNVLDGTGYIVLALAIGCLVFARKTCTPVDLSVQKIALWTALLFFAAVLSASSIHYIYTARFTPFIALAGAALFAKLASSAKKTGLLIGIFIFLMHIAAFRATSEFQKRVPDSDEKQAQLNAAAQIIRENKLDSIPMTGNLVESDIIYLSYKSQRNLVWEK